jgi:hypothetical protein
MLTKTSAELTLFDTLSRLNLARAAKLLGADGKRLIAAGGKYDIDIATQVEFDQHSFRLALNASAVTLALSPWARDRLEWRCDTCDVPCEHAGAAFSLLLEEKLALGLAGTPSERAPLESLSEDALVAKAIAERQERACSEKMRLTSHNPREIWTDYTLTNAASGKSYRVALRGWRPASRTVPARTFARTRLGPASTSSMRSKGSDAGFPNRCAVNLTGSARCACILPTARTWCCASCCHPASIR